MTDSNNSLPSDMDLLLQSTQKNLYDHFQKSIDWQDELYKLGAHKALNIPLKKEIDGSNSNNSATNTINNNGISPKTMIGLGAMLLGGPLLGGLVTYALSGSSNPPAPIPMPIPIQSVLPDHEQKFQIEFFDKDMNPIVIPMAPAP